MKSYSIGAAGRIRTAATALGVMLWAAGAHASPTTTPAEPDAPAEQPSAQSGAQPATGEPGGQVGDPGDAGAVEAQSPSRGGFPAPQPPDLDLGDAPPLLSGVTWLRPEAPGADVDGRGAISPGAVTVVMLFSSWSTPSKAVGEQLRALVDAHAPTPPRIVGVAIWEETVPLAQGQASYAERVSKATSDWPASARIGVAGADSTIAWDWLNAARLTSVPSAFVIDAQGRIVWRGHPRFGLDRVVRATLDGTLDLEAERSREEAARERRNEGLRLATVLQRQVQEEAWQDALATADQILELDPVMFAPTSVTKLRILLTGVGDEPAAFAHARATLEGAQRDNADVLLDMADVLLRTPSAGGRDPQVALELANRVVELSPGDVRGLVTLAQAQAESGAWGLAVQTIERAIHASPDGDRGPLLELRERYAARAGEVR